MLSQLILLLSLIYLPFGFRHSEQTAAMAIMSVVQTEIDWSRIASPTRHWGHQKVRRLPLWLGPNKKSRLFSALRQRKKFLDKENEKKNLSLLGGGGSLFATPEPFLKYLYFPLTISSSPNLI